MQQETWPSYFIGDARVDSTLHRLYADALRVDPVARAAATGRGLDEGAPAFYGAMKDAYMPVTPDLGMLLYALARATAAREAVEFGTSFGISAIWLAAALRENGGRLVTAELDEAKARRAALNLAEAGLAERVEIRTGPAQAKRRWPQACPTPWISFSSMVRSRSICRCCSSSSRVCDAAR
ncbi:O-methyltransferase [Paraburkholderia sp. J12]|uniref:O-methyltransferase n=1 Tax=Paraburkholderia sp. J12 TaxID=2805432 RepID=UPI0039F53B9A